MKLRARPRWRPVSAALALAGLLAAACNSGNEPSEGGLSCADLGSRTFRDSVGDGFYRVIAPNGGESFRIGDSLRVRVTSGALDSEAVLYLAVTANGTTSSIILPGTPRTNIDPRSRCDWAFRIPDSLRAASGRNISLVSDSLRIRIAKYSFESVSDYSDGFFRVTK